MIRTEKRRLIVGVSGASGTPLAAELLRRLRENPDVETHLILTRSAALTLPQETDLTPEDLYALADVSYANDEIGAAPASGSFRTMGMIILPCSMKTVAGIASGYSDSLLLRAADVCLKERRTLVLAARETPLSTLHLRNLYEVSRLGAVVMPPVPAWYRRPVTMEDCVRDTVSRMLDQFGLNSTAYEWKGL